VSFVRRTQQNIVQFSIGITSKYCQSVSREQVDRDSASAILILIRYCANMAMRPSSMGFLTENQKQIRDKHNMNLALVGNGLIENHEREMQDVTRSARTAYKEPKFDGHQAMPAITAQDNAINHTQSTPLAQKGDGKTISAFTQTEIIEMVEISTQTMVEISTRQKKKKDQLCLPNLCQLK
jgi:hypothetical protein